MSVIVEKMSENWSEEPNDIIDECLVFQNFEIFEFFKIGIFQPLKRLNRG